MRGNALNSNPKPTADSPSLPPSPIKEEGVDSMPLEGLRIAVTRPSGQAAALIERVRAAGGEAVILPLLEIVPPATPLHAADLRERMTRADIILFISPSSVRMTLNLLPAEEWPAAPRLAAIGQGTARALRSHGHEHVLTPESGADSEALLAHPAFADVSGQTILLVRGEGGRPLLADTLTARGAHVEHAIVYRRKPSPPDITTLKHGATTIFVMTSSEALRVLLNAATTPEARAWLQAQRYVFGHPRIAGLGQAHGLHGIITESPEDDALYRALVCLAPTGTEERPA